MRGLDGKYWKWEEVLRNILNGKLRNVHNKTRIETDSEDDDDEEEEEEEIPEEAGLVYDTSERDGKYEPIRIDPENDSLQIHTDCEIPQGKISKFNFRRSKRNLNKLNRYGSVPYQRNFGM